MEQLKKLDSVYHDAADKKRISLEIFKEVYPDLKPLIVQASTWFFLPKKFKEVLKKIINLCDAVETYL